MPVSGALCSSHFGWPAVYYVHAAICVVSFTLWILFYRDLPDRHPWVHSLELKKIEQDKKVEKTTSTVPYMEIFRSKTIWAVWVAALGDLISVQLVSMFNPQYMKDFLHYNVLDTGIMAALPVIAQFVVKMFAGISSDAITFLNETLKLRLYNTLALGVSAMFFVWLAFIPNTHPVMAVVVLIITESFIGFNTAGFNKCATLHSRQYGHFIMTQIMNIWAITILIEPFLVNAILGDGSAAGWRAVFLAHAAILLITNGIFCIWADSRPASWAINS